MGNKNELPPKSVVLNAPIEEVAHPMLRIGGIAAAFVLAVNTQNPVILGSAVAVLGVADMGISFAKTKFQ